MRTCHVNRVASPLQVFSSAADVAVAAGSRSPTSWLLLRNWRASVRRWLASRRHPGRWPRGLGVCCFWALSNQNGSGANSITSERLQRWACGVHQRGAVGRKAANRRDTGAGHDPCFYSMAPLAPWCLAVMTRVVRAHTGRLLEAHQVMTLIYTTVALTDDRLAPKK
jgi:hypothetical protein